MSLTCLYLTLMYMATHECKLGNSLMVLLDNTTAENKCNEMIFFIAWLVAIGDELHILCVVEQPNLV